MPTIRWKAACASLLLLASGVVAQGDPQKKPQDPKPQNRKPQNRKPEVKVPTRPAPLIDGKFDEQEWAGAATFDVTRREDRFGRGHVLRSKRYLYIAYRSDDSAFALGIRLIFQDPVSMRTTSLIVAPIHPPRPPLIIAREMRKRKPEPLSAGDCEIRFDFSAKQGFDIEMRIPLDVLEFARSDKSYGFGIEAWDLLQNKLVAGYPLTMEGVTGGRGIARMYPEKDWGADEPLEAKKLPGSEALALLEQLDAEMRYKAGPEAGEPPAPVLIPFLGNRDGRRKDAPIAAIQARLEKLIERYPDYVSLRANLIRALNGRNRLPEALAVHRSIERDFPFIASSPHRTYVESELLFAQGLFAECLELVEARKKVLPKGDVVRMGAMFSGELDAWKAEQVIRAAEAKRDDLPRVRLKTTRGDIVLELYEDDAYNAVANFLTLVGNKFYDKTRFHWVSGAGRIVGGDPNTRDKEPGNDGFGGPGYMIETQPNRRLQFPFTIAYADRRLARRTEGCIFVIHISPLPALDGNNTTFGRVIEGFDIVKSIEYYDEILEATVVRKRDHAYEVVKRP